MESATGIGTLEGRRYKIVLLLVSGAAFLDFLDVTVVNLAFAPLGAEFTGASVADLAWVITGYAVMFAALLAAAGRLADVVGRRRLFLLGIALFTGASLACALAPSLELLVAARLVQGLGAALTLPAGLGIILAEAPPARRAAAVGVWAAAAGAAAAFGPSLGGILVDLFGWRSVFLINVPIGAAILVAGRRNIRDLRPQAERLPDLAGTAALAGGIGLVVLAMTQGETWGWGDSRTAGALIGGLALTGVALLRSLRHPAPAIESGLWRIRKFAFANGASLFFGIAGYAAMLVSVLFLVVVWGYSELEAGFAVSPGAITGAVAAAVTGRVVDQHGQRLAVVGGSLLMLSVFVYVWLALDERHEYWTVFLPGNVLNGIGMGMVAVGLSSVAATAVPPQRFAAATGMNMTARQLGGALGIALLAIILTAAAPGADGYTRVYLMCGFAIVPAAALGLALGRQPREPVADEALGLAPETAALAELG